MLFMKEASRKLTQIGRRRGLLEIVRDSEAAGG